MSTVTDFSKLAEQRLREAAARGDLDNLPGQGRPLAPDEQAAVPPELRVAYKILKNHGLVPREVSLLKQIDAARHRVEAATDADVRRQAVAQLEELCLEYNTLHERHAELEMSSLPPRDK